VQQQSIEAGLRRAVERTEFVLHYQPKINLHSGKIVGVEALIRWNHPQRGLLPPSEFITIAEDCGLILPIGRWALRVSSPFARWMNQRYDRLGPVIADRPKSRAVARELEPKVIAYIHNNPVRAGVVARANESTWTSHQLFAGTSSKLIDTAGCLDRWGFSSFDEFDAWTAATPGESGFPPTRAARKEARLRGGVEVATPLSPHFVPIVARPFAHVRIDPRLLVTIASYAVGAAVHDTGSRKRNPQVLAARFIAVALADRFGVCGSDIAAALGMSPSSICDIRRREPSRVAARALPGAILRVEIEMTALIETRPFAP